MVSKPMNVCGVDFQLEVIQAGDTPCICVRLCGSEYASERIQKVARTLFKALQKDIEVLNDGTPEAGPKLSDLPRLATQFTAPGAAPSETWKENDYETLYVLGATPEAKAEYDRDPKVFSQVYYVLESFIEEYARRDGAKLKEIMNEAPLFSFDDIQFTVHVAENYGGEWSQQITTVQKDAFLAALRDKKPSELTPGTIFDAAQDTLPDVPARERLVRSLVYQLTKKMPPDAVEQKRQETPLSR